MTQQNAALVEQAAAAAESMQEQSIRLAQSVAVFKLAASDERSAQQYVSPPAPLPAAEKRVLPLKRAASPKPAPTMLAKAARPAIGGTDGDDWEEF
jgi:methyl-accepting chemotaxis protein